MAGLTGNGNENGNRCGRVNEPLRDRPVGGPCCGAPAVERAVPSSRWAAAHRQGFCFGPRQPCLRALASERLEQKMRRAGQPILAEVAEPRDSLGRLERLPVGVRRGLLATLNRRSRTGH